MIPQGVNLVVTEDCECNAGIDHRTHDFKDAGDFRTSVDVVPQEHGTSIFWMPECSRGFRIAEFREQRFQFIRVTVNIPDDVVAMSPW